MDQITNTTRQEIRLPKKGGGFIDIPAEGTVSGDLDKDDPRVKGSLHAGVVAVGPPKAGRPNPPEPRSRPEKAG